MGFLRGFSIAMGANIILFVLSFLNNKLIFIVLGKEENGIYLLFMRFSLFIALFVGEWLRLTNINIVGSDKSLNPTVSINNITYIGLVGSISMLAAYYFPSLFSGFIPPQYLLMATLVGLCLILRDVFQSLLLVNNHMVKYGFTYVLWGFIFLFLDVIFLVVYDFGIKSVFASLLISSAVAALWSLFSSIYVNGFSFRPSLKVFGMSGQMGLRAAIAVTGMFLMINVHPFALNVMGNIALVGIFAVCFRMFQLFQRGSDVAGTVIYSNVAQNEEKSGYRLTMNVCRNILFISTLFAVVGGVFGKLLIIIIADRTYLDAYFPLLLMLPGIVFVNTGTILNSSYWGRGYPLKVILAPYLMAGFGLILDSKLIPRFGISGVALSFSVISAVWFMYIVELFRRDSGFKLHEIVVIKYSDFKKIFSKFKIKILRSES